MPNPAAAEVVLRIVDVSVTPAEVPADLIGADGRRIRQLSARHGASGEVEIVWDGRDAFGRRMSAGTYFAQVSGGDNISTARLVRELAPDPRVVAARCCPPGVVG